MATDIVRDRSARLFQYLRELVQLRYPAVHDLRDYDDVLWLADIPKERECSCAMWERKPDEEPSAEYVAADRPDLSSPPDPPYELCGWIDQSQVGNSDLDAPALLEVRHVNEVGQPASELKLADNPAVKTLWETYVESKWWPWALEDRRLRKIQSVYTRLFSMYQQQQHVGGEYEVVLGLGCLRWRSPGVRYVRRHIIAAQLELKFVAQSGTMIVLPAADGAKARLEQDMLDETRPDPATLKEVQQALDDAGDSLLDNNVILDALRKWLNAFDSRATGRFDSSTTLTTGTLSGPVLSYAPAIILRKRTAAGLIRILEDIANRLAMDGPIPAGIRRVVSEDQASVEVEPTTDLTSSEALLFPLPANQDQEEIAQQVTHCTGVLVQGPPGTGKSHTIANLLSHLLAHGKRVLVTSHGPQALAVLKEKLEDAGVAELCVFLLGNDVAAKQSLEKSVHSITEHYDRKREFLRPDATSALEKALDSARREVVGVTKSIVETRERETYRHDHVTGGYSGTAQEIASVIAAEAADLGWLTGNVDHRQDPPLTDDEASELLSLLRSTEAPSADDLTGSLVDPDGLPTPSALDEAVRIERQASAHFTALEKHTHHPLYETAVQVTPSQLEPLSGALKNLMSTYEATVQSPHAWVRGVGVDIMSMKVSKWQELHAFSSRLLESLKNAVAEVADANVTGLTGRDLPVAMADAQALLSHLESGHGLGFWILRPASVKGREYLANQVRVDGKLCRDCGTLNVLVRWLSLRSSLNRLEEHWRDVTAVPTGPTRLQFAAYTEFCRHLEHALSLQDDVNRTRVVLKALGLQWEPAWHQPAELAQLRLVLQAAEAGRALDAARGWFAAANGSLLGAAAGVRDERELAIARRLAVNLDAHDVGGYAADMESLRRLHEAKKRLRRREELLGRLKPAAAEFAHALESTSSSVDWDGRLKAFERAWNWAGVRAWLGTLGDPTEYQRLLERLDFCRKRVLDIKRKLAVAKAWRACLGTDRLTVHAHRELMLWAEENRKIGKGTGKYAEMHRRNAQAHLNECRPAIPAWVMPIHRVADTVKPVPEAFDVAIIDEASQSGPECLLLQYIAKQVVVVGDPEQISPEEVGIPRQVVGQLRQRYIADVGMRDAIEPDTSYFGLAKVLYGTEIRLREHFRCMPEIIRFSNDFCYATKPLIPLKQHGAGRLEPPVVDRFVQGGYQDGDKSYVTNRPEAMAVVDQIVSCLDDERYDGKTLGVICLLGHSQARLIERLLNERVGADELEDRQLICGEPYAFQGAERDVIFLSMVSAVTEGRRIGPLTNDKAKQRFNVAASRAKEQMWLFHSVTLNDLSPDCHRHRLLQFFLGQSASQSVPLSLPIEDAQGIEDQAKSARRDQDETPKPFESWFEVDVFLDLTRLGYRVRPQYESAGYYIDLLVEGLDKTLAVECDGDKWHDSDRFEKDLFRQRMLERCGWEFWRIRGSDYYRDRDACVKRLCGRLESMGIVPVQCEAEVRAGQAERPNEEEQLAAATSEPTEVQVAPARQENGENMSRTEPERGADRTERRQVGGVFTYRNWQVRDLPDPRGGGKREVAAQLLDIVGAEGPVLVSRMYSLYAKGARLGRAGRLVRRELDTALGHLYRTGKIDIFSEELSPRLKERVVVLKGTDRVVVRTLGERTLDEVPLSELASVLRDLENRGYREEEPLFRRVLERYGRAVLTHAATVRLRAARRMAVDGHAAADPQPDMLGQSKLEL